MSEVLLKDQIAIAQTRVVLETVRINVLASLVTATVLLLLLTREYSLTYLAPWYLVYVVVTFLRFFHVRTVNKGTLDQNNYKRQLLFLTILSCASGSLWGVLGFFSVSYETISTSIIVVMIFTGLAANASATLSHVLPVFIGFVFPMMLPVAYKLFTFGDVQYYWVSGLIIFYLSVTLLNIRGIRSALKQSIKLRNENLELIETLKVQNSKTQKALEKAEQANLAKSRFFAAASHDLRQPLQSLSMFTATLATKSKESEQKNIVTQIEKSVNSLEGLFNSLLDISSLDAGTLKYQKQHIYLQEQIVQIIAEFSEQASTKPLFITVRADEHVVYTDPVLLGRLLRNLIENAIRYTPSGGIDIRVEPGVNEVLLSIADTGIGISPNMQSSVFNEFVQLDNPERDRNKGLGLGLSIVQRICDMLDMRLALTSELNNGSIFSMGIEPGDESLVAGQTPIEEASCFLQELFVLVIDDEEDVRISIEGLLHAWGCVVMVASSGEEAVQQLIEYGSTPDVIISDYRLRDNATGGDAIAMVSAHCGVELPAIIVTGDIAPERLIEIDKLNIPVLHKPCSPERLRALLLAVSP